MCRIPVSSISVQRNCRPPRPSSGLDRNEVRTPSQGSRGRHQSWNISAAARVTTFGRFLAAGQGDRMCAQERARWVAWPDLNSETHARKALILFRRSRRRRKCSATFACFMGLMRGEESDSVVL
jgi:hypothetical protein